MYNLSRVRVRFNVVPGHVIQGHVVVPGHMVPGRMIPGHTIPGHVVLSTGTHPVVHVDTLVRLEPLW